MSRAPLNYSAGAAVSRAYEGYNPDVPEAGYYRMRMRGGGVFVGVRIWHGPPHDPVTGEELDRSWRWQATVNGRYIDLDRVWPQCAADRISPAEHDHLASLQAWGAAHGHDALADPRKRLDPLKTPLMF